jgi:uncharacterized protein (TIGR03083 family)
MRAMEWLALLTRTTDDFAACLAAGDLDAPVPSCPGWTLADLGEHLRGVHLWAAHAITEGNPQGSSEPVARERLVDGYRAASRHLLEVLDAAGADGPAWTFGPEPVAGFWRRRQVHETTLHLYDALLSQDHESTWTIAPDLAWDGVEEVATVFYPRQVRLGRIEPLRQRLVVTGSDVGATTSLGEGDPVALTGTARQVLLTLWKRVPAADPDVAAVLSTAITP